MKSVPGSRAWVKTHVSGFIVRAPVLPSPSTCPSTNASWVVLLSIQCNGEGEELSVTLLRHYSLHTANAHALPALDSPASPADGQLAQLGYDGKATAKEMYPDIDESALIRKIDLRVVPILCLLFFFAFLDRFNIANAAVYGMSSELKLVGDQYNGALTIL